MDFSVVTGDITQLKADAIIVNLFQGVTSPGGATGAVDSAMGQLITEELTQAKTFKGELGETMTFHTHGKIPARYVVLVGLGKQDDFNGNAIRRASAAAIRAVGKLKVKTVGSIVHGAGVGGQNPEVATRLLVEGTLLGSYKFTLRKTKKEDDAEKALETFIIVETDESKRKDIEEGIRVGQIIAASVNEARDLVMDSANHATPTRLKEFAEDISGLKCKVLDFDEAKQMGMGAFCLVAQGSDQPSYIVHMSYKPKGTPKKKICLVGKGITFDSGGLSLKPPKSQETMKMDMAGAAAVLGTMKAISRLKDLDVQVDGFIATCENMISGHSSKPGDVITTLKGTTVEVNNTDAEGRLILIDTLTHAQKETDPDVIIDLATLTGACVVALGEVAAAAMGSQSMVDEIKKYGERAGEKFWQFPLYEEYKQALKSDVADLINAGSKGKAGTTSAAMFLKEFVDDKRAWAHLDIAGPAYTSGDTPEVPKGGTGFGVRSLLYYLYNLD